VSPPHSAPQSRPGSRTPQREIIERIRARRLEADNKMLREEIGVLRTELSSQHDELSRREEDLELANEKYQTLVAEIGKLLTSS
jgi:hypothetical protein